MSRPEITATADGYRLKWNEGVEATVERLAEHRDELSAELTVWTSRAPQAGLLHQARLNLMSSQTRRTLAAHLERRDADLDWTAMLDQLCFLVVDRHRAGEPTLDMRVYVHSGKPRWHVHPFIETGGPTILFGDGGVGKSVLATAIAVTAASGSALLGLLEGRPAPALFLDYETTADTFRERLGALCEGVAIPIPPVHYRREYASLPEAAPAVRREMDRLGIGTVIVDSVGLACGGDPQAADVTLAFFRAVDSLRVPCLVVDHIAKNGPQETTKAYGSVYKSNRPRLAWRVDKADRDDGPVMVALSEHKHNDVKRPPRLGYRMSFTTGEGDVTTKIEIGHADLRRDFPEQASMRDRILATLTARPLTRAELAEAVGGAERSVQSRVAEMIRAGVLTATDEGKIWVVRTDN